MGAFLSQRERGRERGNKVGREMSRKLSSSKPLMEIKQGVKKIHRDAIFHFHPVMFELIEAESTGMKQEVAHVYLLQYLYSLWTRWFHCHGKVLFEWPVIEMHIYVHLYACINISTWHLSISYDICNNIILLYYFFNIFLSYCVLSQTFCCPLVCKKN